MSKFTQITDKALDLAGQAGTQLKHMIPSADRLLQTGAALGAVKAGGKVAGGFVRRNPVIAVAAVAGAGLVWYAAHRKRRQALLDGPIEGKSRRVDAKRVNGTGKDAASAPAGTRARKAPAITPTSDA